MLEVKLIGPPLIEASGGERREVRGHKAWAVLARILLADRPLPRRALAAELFPEADDPLGSLRWCLAGLRKALGDSELFVGDPISRQLPAGIVVDVHQLLDHGIVDDETTGDLLDGIDPSCGPEFTSWLLVTRQQVSARIAARLREEVIVALSRREHDRALRVAQLLVRRSPYDEGAHVLLVKALVGSGHSDAALQHVRQVAQTFEAELGSTPSPALHSATRSHIDEPPPGVAPATVTATLLESGRAALSAGAIDAGVDCLRQATARAEKAGDLSLLATCLLALGSALVHAVRGFDDEGSVLLEQAARLAHECGASTTAATARCERGYADAMAGRRPEALGNLDQAEELADGDPALLARVHSVAAFNQADWGRSDDALARYRLALECARSAGDRRREAWTLGLGAWALLADGQAADATRWSKDCLAVVHGLRWASFEPWPTTVLAEAALVDGDPTGSAVQDLERCFARSCQLADPCWEGGSGRAMAVLLARTGALDEALDWITEARTRSLRKADVWTGLVGTILVTEAELRSAAGDVAGARAAARDAASLAARAHLDRVLPVALQLMSATTDSTRSG